MQRQGGGSSCWRAGGELVNGPCAPVRGGSMVPGGCVTGQCGLTAMGGGGCPCGTGINPKLFGGGRRNRKATRRNRKQTRKNRRCWSRKNTRRNK